MVHIEKNKTKLPSNIKRKIFISSGCGIILIAFSVAIIVIDPIARIAIQRSSLVNGTEFYDVLQREIVSMHISVYVFNITNPNEFLEGEEKLKLEEVGPFTYEEIRLYKNFEHDDVNNIISYSPHNTLRFLPEKSIADPKDVKLNLPNIVLLSFSSKMSTYPYMVRAGFNAFTYHLNSKAIIEVSVEEFLWGYKDPLLTIGNKLIPGWIDFEAMGVLDRIYNQERNPRLDIDSSDANRFLIKYVNGSGGLDMWQYDDISKRTRCNTFTDTYEGISYPTRLRPERPIRIYRDVFCRIIDMDFVEEQTLPFGAKGLRYKMSNRTYTVNNDTECLCAENVCMDGISDVSPCYYGLPLVLSNAHFMGTDPKLYANIEGMRPNEEKHNSEIVIDPIMGLALNTTLLIQINILMRDVRLSEPARMFSDMILPVSYFKIVQPELSPAMVDHMKELYVRAPNMFIVIESTISFVGIILILYATCVFLSR